MARYFEKNWFRIFFDASHNDIFEGTRRFRICPNIQRLQKENKMIAFLKSSNPDTKVAKILRFATKTKSYVFRENAKPNFPKICNDYNQIWPVGWAPLQLNLAFV